jgi:hypothetical protein
MEFGYLNEVFYPIDMQVAPTFKGRPLSLPLASQIGWI